MVAHPFRVNAADVSGLPGSTLLDEFVQRVPFGLDKNESLSNFDFSTGTAPKAIIEMKSGVVFWYDPTDTTSAAANDVLVSSDGKRYKSSEGSALQFASIISVLTAPPGSPSVHDAYLVGVAATGAWAGQDNAFAVYTPRGWKFSLPYIGSLILNESTGAYLHNTAAGLWTDLPFSITDSSIRLEKIKHPMGMSVEAQQNAPPGSPTVETYYIVGLIPTGAWVGQANKIAYWSGTAWQFIPPYDGAEVYNKAVNSTLTYVSTAWVIVGGQVLNAIIARINVNKTSALVFANLTVDIATFQYQGDTSKYLRIGFQPRIGDAQSSLTYEDNGATQTSLNTSFIKIGLKRDAESSYVEEYVSIEGLLAGSGTYVLPLNRSSNPFGSLFNGLVDFGFHKVLDALNHTYKIRLESVSTNVPDKTGYTVDGDWIVEEWTA